MAPFSTLQLLMDCWLLWGNLARYRSKGDVRRILGLESLSIESVARNQKEAAGTSFNPRCTSSVIQDVRMVSIRPECIS